MFWFLKFGWKRKGFLMPLAGAGLIALVAFQSAIGLDEGRKRHLKKQLFEAGQLPGRLMT